MLLKMENYLFIFIVFTLFTKNLVFGLECFDLEQSNDNDNFTCVNTCIKILFNKSNCVTCYRKSSLHDIWKADPKKVLFHDYMVSASDDAMHSYAECSDCDSEFGKEVYKRPNSLVSLLEILDPNSKVLKSNASYDELYKDVKQKFNTTTMQCIDILKLNELLDDLGLPYSDAEFDELESDETDSEELTSKEYEEYEQDDPKIAPITTETIIIEITTAEPIIINNNNNNNNSFVPKRIGSSLVKSKPILEEHHYFGALFYIGVILSILTLTFMISAVVLAFYTNRRKRLDIEWGSSSYPLNLH